ncbi:MAG: tRNA pseudouridine(54/55) synthase Pus10, partial [Thermoplasmata archaeon]|nr:tRNA pseudouridine(54/55) synthase Pus10 [Candidatus Sysuiplasma superficiale]
KLSAAIEEISGKTLAQRTPVRVAHRRADKVRERRIIECSLLEYDGDIASVLVRAQSGTYIKEFVTGDEGRTQPSISAALNSSCEVISLDVLDVSTGADKLW